MREELLGGITIFINVEGRPAIPSMPEVQHTYLTQSTAGPRHPTATSHHCQRRLRRLEFRQIFRRFWQRGDHHWKRHRA